MPQIQDYAAPETQAQEPVGGISPNLEAVSAPGRALERIGTEVEQVGSILHRREASAEISTIDANVSQARTDFTTQLANSVNDPNFKVDEFKKNYADWVDKQADTLDTAEAKDHFTRQSARLGGALLSRAGKLQAIAVGNQAKVQLQGSINSNALTLEADPTQFEDIRQSSVETVDAMVKANPSLGAARPMLLEHLQEQYAMAALRGAAKSDPGSLEENRPGAGQAAIDDGHLMQYLKPMQQQDMREYVKRQAHAADVDKARQEKAAGDITDQHVEDWRQQVLPLARNGTLSAKDILDAKLPDGSPVPSKDQEHMLDLVHKYSREQFEDDPRVVRSLIRRISPDYDGADKIYDSTPILNQMAKGGVSWETGGRLQGYIKKTPEYQETMAAEKNLMKMAQSLKKRNLAEPGYSQASLDKFQHYYEDLQAEKKSRVQQGLPLGPLFAADGPDSFYSKMHLPKYQTTQDEMFNSMMATQGTSSAAVPAQKVNGGAGPIQKGESMGAYLQRVNEFKAKSGVK